MEKNLKNKVWNLLPTEFKEEVINRYNQNIGNVYNFESMVEANMLENLFGSENIKNKSCMDNTDVYTISKPDVTLIYKR